MTAFERLLEKFTVYQGKVEKLNDLIRQRNNLPCRWFWFKCALPQELRYVIFLYWYLLP